MRMLGQTIPSEGADLVRLTPSLALLLWSAATVFIFGILTICKLYSRPSALAATIARDARKHAENDRKESD
jgi:hypothetical protein